MAFSNRIRLPFKLLHPQYPETADRYRKANGETVTLSVVVRKVYDAITDNLPEKIHERLKIALVHDNVQIEGSNYVGVIAQDGDYQIEWPEFLNYPLGQAKFKAEVTPFNATNSNCGTCEEYAQVVTNDDDLGSLNEDQNYTISPLDNDAICCSPITISLITTNSTFIDNVTIDQATNEISFHTKASIPAATDVIIMTYRAQCDNGMYDESNVIADINGSLPGCLAPTSLNVTDITDNSATINWTDPDSSYFNHEWKLYRISDLINPEQTGTTAAATTEQALIGLDQNMQYRFSIRAVCGNITDGFTYSNFASVDFTTEAASAADSCGSYRLLNIHAFGGPGLASFLNCVGAPVNRVISNLQSIDVCMLQSSPGVPFDLDTTNGIAVEYLGLC